MTCVTPSSSSKEGFAGLSKETLMALLAALAPARESCIGYKRAECVPSVPP